MRPLLDGARQSANYEPFPTNTYLYGKIQVWHLQTQESWGKNINKVNKIDGDAYFLGFIILLPFYEICQKKKSDLNKWIVYLCIPLPLENGPAK